jgi:HMGL-like
MTATLPVPVDAEAGHVRLTDSTLRDGSHAMAHQFTEGQVRAVVHALDRSNVEVIEVAHGDGLGGSSFNYGFSRVSEFDLIAAAVEEAETAKIAVLLLPGLGTVEHLRRAREVGASVARIATHCTEADVSVQHFGAARELGMETVGFLMLSHRIGPAELAEQARIMVDAGAQCIYVVDSAGALVLSDAQARVQALLDAIGSHAQVGFHGPTRTCRWASPTASSPCRPAPARSTAPCARSAPAPATHPPKCSPPPSTGSASAPASTSRACSPRPKTCCGQSSRGCRSLTAPPSCRATPACTAASSSTPNAPPNATALARTRSCNASARPAMSVAKKT